MRPDEIASTVATINATLLDSCTNSRTAETHPCRLTPQTRMERLPQLPHYVRLPTFALKQPDGVSVKSGDSLSIVDGRTGADKGTYNTLEVLTPQTYSFSTLAMTLLARRPDGAVGIRADASIQFRQRYIRAGHTQPDTIGPYEVMVDYLDPQAVQAGSSFSFRIAVTWDDSIVFPDLQKPSEGDFAIWTGVANGKAALRFPRPLVVLPALTAYLEGTPA